MTNCCVYNVSNKSVIKKKEKTVFFHNEIPFFVWNFRCRFRSKFRYLQSGTRYVIITLPKCGAKRVEP